MSLFDTVLFSVEKRNVLLVRFSKNFTVHVSPWSLVTLAICDPMSTIIFTVTVIIIFNNIMMEQLKVAGVNYISNRKIDLGVDAVMFDIDDTLISSPSFGFSGV